MYLTTEIKKDIFKKHGKKAENTGSSEGQIALFSHRISHLTGHLQSNKARKAVKIFDVIHTLDSIELAERLERICIEEKIETISVLMSKYAQINLKLCSIIFEIGSLSISKVC